MRPRPRVLLRAMQLALDHASDPPQAFGEIIKADTAKWAKVIKEANIKAEQ